MEKEKSKWLPLPATETAENIASLIVKKYEEYAEEEIPEDKLMTLLYFCVRDTSYITQHYIIKEKFEIHNYADVKLNISLPSLKTLRKQSYVIHDSNLKVLLETLIEQYSVIENWKLKQRIGRTYAQLNRVGMEEMLSKLKQIEKGKLTKFPPKEVTLDMLWEDAKRNINYKYYTI